MTRLQADIEAMLESLAPVLVTQAREAIEALLDASAEAGQEGLVVLSKIADVGALLAEGKIDPVSAGLATENYLEALRLRGYALSNRAQVEALHRGVATLKVLASVALAVLQLALGAAVPALGVFLSGVVERVAASVGQAEGRGQETKP